MKQIIRKAYVKRYNWALGDSYLDVNLQDFQVFEEDGWKEGDEVEATISIKKVER